MKAGVLVVAISCFCGFFVVLLIIHWPIDGAMVVLLLKVRGRVVVLLTVVQGLVVVLLAKALGDVVVLLRLFCLAFGRRNCSLLRLLGPEGALEGELVVVRSYFAFSRMNSW